MNENTVAILMSTYNGAKYLKDQLQSIINQSYSNWHLYIRDDGSSDETVEIIKSYAKKDSRISIIHDTLGNIGSVRSFFYLLEQVDSNFYMFSDQDDYWKQDKIQKSILLLKQHNHKRKPICVYTNLQIVDDNLEGNELLLTKTWQDFPKLFFTNNLYGCTMLFNNFLKEKIKFDRLNYDNIYVHDWWLALVCAIFGEIYYLDEPTILYRQHYGNQIGATSKNINVLIKRLFSKSKDEKSLQSTILFAEELEKLYGAELKSSNIQGYVKNYATISNKSSFFNNLKIILRFPPKSVHLSKELFYMYILVFNPRLFFLK
ncbi:glycosyltransferase family 2 protein [Limosilactobacillus reuteri]|uniref:glycosyltransferase family 2 protein n=1 Tax=Limosilactobacillus reuteri TaxID=1598 RepID=UPI001E34A718|nr:glycosyltransferase family 2 protein [Limosilactobacillus reuteri]MCC4482224.1 glycosyltransferase family 2 protein [Limosilactobacillus reuteri]MDD1379962.1 glycosyltransferase family 2 protein [Limosilactobacillus reuteri]